MDCVYIVTVDGYIAGAFSTYERAVEFTKSWSAVGNPRPEFVVECALNPEPITPCYEVSVDVFTNEVYSVSWVTPEPPHEGFTDVYDTHAEYTTVCGATSPEDAVNVALEQLTQLKTEDYLESCRTEMMHRMHRHIEHWNKRFHGYYAPVETPAEVVGEILELLDRHDEWGVDTTKSRALLRHYFPETVEG